MKTIWGFAALATAGLSLVTLAQVAPPPPAKPPSPTGTSSTQGRGSPPAVKPFVTTGLILGRVIDAATGGPVTGAVVALTGGPARVQTPPVAGQPSAPPAPPPQLLTDSEGRFAFRFLTRGNYSLVATKSGYSSGAYGRTRPNGPSRSLQMDDGEKVVDVTLKVFKYGSISGTVTDDAGEPVVGAGVRLYRRNLVAGRRVLSQMSGANTDDRGVYRLSSLAAGEYLVMVPVVAASTPAALSAGAAARMNADATSMNVSFNAVPPGSGGRQITADGTFLLASSGTAGAIAPDPSGPGKWRSYATQWYPGSTTLTNAQPVVLSVGEERSGIDFNMQYVPTSTITGQVIGPEGPAAQYILRLVPNDTGEWTGEPEAALTTTDPNGTFQFLTIPAGNYTIQTVRTPQNREVAWEAAGVGTATIAVPPAQTQPTLLFATQTVSVGADDISGLVVTLQEGFKLSGRLEFLGSRARPTPSALTQISIVVDPADGRPQNQPGPAQRPTPDGRFTTHSFLPGKYFLRAAGVMSGWTLQSINVNGVEATETPIDLTQNISGVIVTFTDQISDVRGVARKISPEDEAPAVLVFPANSAAWKDFGANPIRMRRTVAAAGGSFSFGTLPPGDYLAIAVPEEFSGEWQDPAYLEVLSRTAVRFSLSPGERRTLDLSVQNVRPPGSGRLPASEANVAPLLDGSGPFVPDESPQQTRDTRPAASLPAGAGSISGIVMQDEGSPRPARLARVSVRSSALHGERITLTGDDGRFVIDHLPPGSYQVQVTKPSYLLMYYGGTRPTRGPGTNVVLDGKKPVTDLKITLTRGAVVTGTVFDSEGQPAANVRVQLMSVQTVDGERVLTSATVNGSNMTDDRGAFRLFGIRSGSYVLIAHPPTTSSNEVRQLSDQEMRAAIAEAASGIKAASIPSDRVLAPGPGTPLPSAPAPGRAVSYSPVFYPGTVNEQEAGVFAVTAGQETANINIPISLLPAARIEGAVSGPDGQPLTGTVSVTLQRLSAFSSPTISVRSFEGGRFQALGVPPGAYTLNVRHAAGRLAGGVTSAAPPGPPPTYWAREELFVNGADISNVSLQLRPPITITGKLTIEGAGNGKDAQLQLTQYARPGTMSSTSVRADADGVFKFANVTPGRYRIGGFMMTPAQQATWAVKAATLDGRDALESYVEIAADRLTLSAAVTLTASLPEVTGQITSQAGAPVTDVAAVLFATDPKHWSGAGRRVRSMSRVNNDGTYRFTGLLPGEYCLVVLVDLDTAELQDPTFLEQLLPAGIRMTLAEREKKVQNVKLAVR